MEVMDIQRSDLLKIYDALKQLVQFHKLRDEMNATLHYGEVRYSPLTVNAMAELERLERILDLNKLSSKDNG